jgi:hypothetical protein
MCKTTIQFKQIFSKSVRLIDAHGFEILHGKRVTKISPKF